MEERISHVETLNKGKKINSKSNSMKVFERNHTENAFQGILVSLINF